MKARFIRRSGPRVKGYRSCRCNRDHWHQSRLEAGYCNQLDLLERAGEIKGYEIQKTFELKVKGKTITRHRVDFLVTNNEGKKEVHEVKGFATDVWNIKRKLFEALYPDIPYFVIR